MATTLKLIETFQTETRKSGEISYIKVQVVLDDIPTNTSFRSKVGEEPIIVDGDTITVSDAQVDHIRGMQVVHAKQQADRRAQDQREFEQALRFMEADLDNAGASDEARTEMRDLYNRDMLTTIAAKEGSFGEAVTAFKRHRRDILKRHGLRGFN